MNVARLAAILRHTGLNVRIGSLLPEITAPTTLDLPDGQTLALEPLRAWAPAAAGSAWKASTPAPCCSTTTSRPACRTS